MQDAVVSAVIGALRAQGLDARGRYDPTALSRGEALVCVGIKSSRTSASGMGEYLGNRSDPERGELPIFGLRAEMVLSLDIYVPESEGTQGCAGVLSRVSEALFTLPSGIKRRELCCLAPAPDAQTRMFAQSAELGCTAYFVCAAEEESGEFVDFMLKGVLRNVSQ